jgi:hypothetical protein
MFMKQVTENQASFMSDVKKELLSIKSANNAEAEIAQASKKAAYDHGEEDESAERDRQRDAIRDKERSHAAYKVKSSVKESSDRRAESNNSDGSGLMGQLLRLKDMPQFQGVININAQPAIFKAQQKRCSSCEYKNPATESLCLNCRTKF